MGLDVLLPSGSGSVDEVLRSVRPAVLPAGRPHVVANMITTIDGAAALEGSSGAVNRFAPGDHAVFSALREQADAVLAGTSTIAQEQYGRLIADEAARARRVGAGLQPDPIAVLLSRSGRLPDHAPLLRVPEQPRRVFTGEEAEPAAALATLRARDGVELLLCEGGPTLLGALIRAGLVDELFVTLSPVLATGSPERTLLGGDAGSPRPLALVGLLHEGGGLHARYAMLAPGDGPSSPSDDATPGAS